jgi:hypothetical protein
VDIDGCPGEQYLIVELFARASDQENCALALAALAAIDKHRLDPRRHRFQWQVEVPAKLKAGPVARAWRVDLQVNRR